VIIRKLLHKIISYCFFCFSLIVFSLSFPSCKTSASATSTTAAKTPLNEKNHIILEATYIEACKEKIAGKPEMAERLFRECLKYDPNNAPVKYELAKLLPLTGRLDEASKMAKEAIDADPKNQWYHLAYIDILHQKKDFAGSAEAYEKLIKNFPERSDLMEAMAYDYAMSQNFNKAFKIYDDLEKRYGKEEVITLNKVKLLKQLRKFSEAETELKKMIELNPTEPRYYLYLAEFYEDMNDFAQAKTIYDKLLVLDPTNPRVHLVMAEYYKEQGKAEESHAELKTALANPDLELEIKIKYLQFYLEVYERFPEFLPKAYELCEVVLKVNPMSSQAHAYYARFLAGDKKIDEAYKEYLTAARLGKTSFAVWSELLDLESYLKKFDSLEIHSAEAMELFPNQAQPYFYNGVANRQLRNYKKSAQSFYDGLEFVYDDKALMLNFYTSLGDVYAFLEEHEKSDKAYDDALKINPDDPYVLNNYAYYLSVRKEKLDKAEKLSKRSNDLVRENASYIDTYGWILFQQAKYEEAEDWLARAVKLAPTKPLILEHYGDVLYKLGKTEDALKYWKKANEAGGNSDALLKKISTKKLQ
jgi:tetratricopeptide (TPR) repeat protein